MGSRDMTDYNVHVVRLSDKAVLVKHDADDDDDDAFWLPLSQIEGGDNVTPGEGAILGVPDWLAREKHM